MRREILAFRAGVVMAALWMAAPLFSQSAGAVAQTSEGKPDLNGIWRVRDNQAEFGLEAHSGSKGIPKGKSVIIDPPDGKIPYKPEALAKRKQNFENRATLDPVQHCYMPGVPRLAYMHFPFQIFQTPDRVQIIYEYVHEYRNIYLNGTPHIDGLDFWDGDSRGHWEGNTLVVDVADFNDKTWFDAVGDYHSSALHVVERYTRSGPDTIQYEATIEDPNVFTKPWKIAMTLHRDTKPNARLMEYECQTFAGSKPGEEPLQ